jgi:hypothetical protein
MPETIEEERDLLDSLLLERFGRRPRRPRIFESTDPADTRECPFSLPRSPMGLPGVLD